MIIIFIRNRQRSALSLPAERQWNCTLRQVAEKSPKGAPSLDRGEGPHPPDLPQGPSPPGPSFSFPQRQVCYDKDVILRRICTYAVQSSAIWLPLGRQIRAFSSYFKWSIVCTEAVKLCLLGCSFTLNFKLYYYIT